MVKRHWFSVGALVLCAAAVFAQTLPSTFPPPKRFRNNPAGSGEARVFRLGGQAYISQISNLLVTEGPDWSPSMPPPLNLAKVEEIALSELHKLLPEAKDWETTEISLKRCHCSEQPKWFYVVRLEPAFKKTKESDDSFYVLMNCLGEPGPIRMDIGIR
jgi:hypothetical protein